MIVWRFSLHATLDGRGGLFASGRWHSRGHEILYCAPNPATALLEVMVHGAVRKADAFGGFQFLKIELPDSVSRQYVEEARLDTGWTHRMELTQAVGDDWLQEGRAAVLLVPSVLLPETNNLLINSRHADAVQLKLLATVSFPLDERLFRPG